MEESFSKWFWNDEFWLPPNSTWEDVNTKTSHLAYPLVIGLVLVVVRWLVEGLVFRPLGKTIGIKHHKPNR